MRRTLVVCSLIGVLACVASPALASTRGDAARRGADWLAGQQQADGGFFSSGQRVDQTAETLASMIAGGVSGRPVNRAVAYLRKHAAGGATRGAYTGRIVAALIAAGEDPREFANTDFVARLDDQYNGSSGVYDGENLFSNLLGANGTVAVRRSLPDAAVAYIKDNACGDGGFGFENGCAEGPDVDTSAWVINVFTAAGRKEDPAVASAKGYILSVQRDDGGFGFTADKSTSADSTGLVLSAIEALGERTTKPPWRQDDGGDPVKALLALEHSSGGFRFVSSSRNASALSTINAVPGLAKVAYPVPTITAAATPTPTTRATTAPRPAQPPAPRATSGPGTQPGVTNNATSTATQASPGTSGAQGAQAGGSAASPLRSVTFTPQPGAPFGDTAAAEPAQTVSPAALWTGLGVVVAASGAGTWLYLRRRSVA